MTVLGRNRAALDEVVAAGLAHFAVVADVADQAAVNAAIAEAAARQPIDILVANAGARNRRRSRNPTRRCSGA